MTASDTAPHCPSPAQAERQHWLAVLARASRQELETALAGLHNVPDYQLLRPPEAGLLMVRGRAGGSGMRFNLGEVTVARCAIRTAHGVTGNGYVQGRDLRRAELVALFDALLQMPARQPALMAGVIGPLENAQAAARKARAERSKPTRVDFFTLVRGQD